MKCSSASPKSKDAAGNCSSSLLVPSSSFLVAVFACIVAHYYYHYWSFYEVLDSENSSSTPNDQQQQQHNNDVLHAISGAIGSALSISLLYPLETVRTRLQVQVVDVDDDITTSSSSSSSKERRRPNKSTVAILCNIVKSEGGVSALYRGWYSLVVALMILNFVYFYCFRVVRRFSWLMVDGYGTTGGANMNNDNDDNDHNDGDYSSWMKSKVVIDLVAGYAAGCVAVLITGPLWLVNTRLKLQGVKFGSTAAARSTGDDDTTTTHNDTTNNRQYTGIIQCLYKITKEEGVLTLWNGTFTSIILALNPAIQLGVYEMLKRHHYYLIIICGRILRGDDNSNNSGSSSLEAFVNALIAKFISTVITYPIQVLQTRHRAGLIVGKKKNERDDALPQSQERKGYIDIVLGLYRGLESKLLQTCLNSALMFVVYERLVDILSVVLLNRKMS